MNLTRIYKFEGQRKEEFVEDVVREVNKSAATTVEEYWHTLKDRVVKRVTEKCRNTSGVTRERRPCTGQTKPRSPSRERKKPSNDGGKTEDAKE